MLYLIIAIIIIIIIIILLLITGGYYCYDYYYCDSIKNEKIITRQQSKLETYNNNISENISENNNEKNNEKNNVFDLVNNSNHRALYELYYSGVPDIYDNENNKIPGMEPNILKAIDHLYLLLNSDIATDEDHLNLAKIYHLGAHKFEPDFDKAISIYSRLLKNTRNTEIVLKCNDALKDIYNIKARLWLNLPLKESHVPDVEEEQLFQNDHVNVMNVMNVMNDTNVMNNINNFQLDELPTDEGVRNDTQNVHETTVLKTIKVSLDKLKEGYDDSNSVKIDTKKELIDIINKMPHSDKKTDAIKSLNSINNEFVSSIGNTEKEVLDLVYRRIKDKHSEDVMNHLITELAEMQEFGTTVCSTGKVTRLVDTLNLIDEDVTIKPTYAINGEMLEKAAKIRNDLLDSYPETEKMLYEKGTSEKQNEYEELLKSSIKDTLKKDYVDSGILTKETLTFEISKWINEI